MQKLQHGCCLSCHCPLKNYVRAYNDEAIDRCLNYIEGLIKKDNEDDGDKDENVTPQIKNLKFLGVKHNAHMIHETQCIPALQAFISGEWKDVWFDNELPETSEIIKIENGKITFMGEDALVTTNIATFRVGETNKSSGNLGYALFWHKPTVKVKGFVRIHHLFEMCSTTDVYTPAVDETFITCQMCNSAMSQQKRFADFLANRDEAFIELLVPQKKIVRIEVSDKFRERQQKYIDNISFMPPEDCPANNPEKWCFTGCLGYYIHRCLPNKDWVNRYEKRKHYRGNIVITAFLILEIACLIITRKNSAKDLDEPQLPFRYRATAELYISYLFWIFLKNDYLGIGYNHQDFMHKFPQFIVFHRYIFSEMADFLCIMIPYLLNFKEIIDVIMRNSKFYNQNDFSNISADDFIDDLIECIINFYNDFVSKYFNAHLHGKDPDKNLMALTPDKKKLYAMQVEVYNYFPSVNNLFSHERLMERMTTSNIKNFIQAVGIQAVFNPWVRLMNTLPPNIEELCRDMRDTFIKKEFYNIRNSVTDDEGKPVISIMKAESMYLLCCLLDNAREPENEMELQNLRQMPRCSPLKSCWRLIEVGAIKQDF